MQYLIFFALIALCALCQHWLRRAYRRKMQRCLAEWKEVKSAVLYGTPVSARNEEADMIPFYEN